MPYRISDIPDIRGQGAALLSSVRIETTEDLLRACAHAPRLAELSTSLGLSEERVQGWVRKAGLMRIWRLGPRHAALLEEAGVAGLDDLSTRQPRPLTLALQRINLARRIVRATPTEAMIRDWIEQAGRLASPNGA